MGEAADELTTAEEADDELVGPAITARVLDIAKKAPDTSDGRRLALRDMMLDGLWNAKYHAVPVGEVWGLEGRAVVNIAVEVGRWMRLVLGAEGQRVLRDKLTVKTHDMLAAVSPNDPRAFEQVGKIALPLAGVSTAALVPSVVVVMMPGETLRVPTEGLARWALAEPRAGAALRALVAGEQPPPLVVEATGEEVVEPIEVSVLREAADAGDELAAVRLRAYAATDSLTHADALVGLERLLEMVKGARW